MLGAATAKIRFGHFNYLPHQLSHFQVITLLILCNKNPLKLNHLVFQRCTRKKIELLVILLETEACSQIS